MHFRRSILLLAVLTFVFQASVIQAFAQSSDVTNSEDVTFSITSPKDGSLWIATSSRGLLRLGATGRCFSYNSSKGDFTCDAITAVYFDSEGNLWMKDADGSVWTYSEITGFSMASSAPESISLALASAVKPIGESLTVDPGVNENAESDSSSRTGIAFWWLIFVFLVSAGIGFGLSWALQKRSKVHVSYIPDTVDSTLESGPETKLGYSGKQEEKSIPKVPLKQEGPLPENASEFYGKVLSIVNARFTDPDFSVEDIAAEFAISRVHLNRKLKSDGCPSPGELIKTTRMEAAAAMISSGENNMASVAEKCGFSSPAYFSSAFKEYYGVTPKGYKI